MISIVMSTYRRPVLLKRAIESVLAQTYQGWELIVVDDHSQDETEDVVESFNDARIRLIKRKKNFGCDTQPKNYGIIASKGDYVAFLDDDNEYRPEHLAILYKEITKDPSPDVVYGDRMITCDEKDESWMPDQVGFTHDYDPQLLMRRNFMDTSDVLVKRKALFDVGGFDERYTKYIDWNLWVRMTKYGKTFKHVPMIVTNYHLHSGMKSLRVKTQGDSPTTFIPEWDPYDVEVELPYLGTVPREPRVAVFSITYNRLAYTKKSFKSLHATAGYAFDHYVVDNGSTDGTVDWLKSHIDPDKLILNDKNVGISLASNQAIDAIVGAQKYDVVLKWDNDCIGLTPDWLTVMCRLWKSNHKMAMSCYVQGLVDNPGGAPRVGYGQLCKELIGVTKHLGGICHFVDIHAYDTFRWEPESFLHGVQDMELSQWLLFHGYAMGYLENYFVSHGPQGTQAQKADYPDYFEKRAEEKRTRYAKNG